MLLWCGKRYALSFLAVYLQVWQPEKKSGSNLSPPFIFCIYLGGFVLVYFYLSLVGLFGLLIDIYIKTLASTITRDTGGVIYKRMQPQSILYIFRPPYQNFWVPTTSPTRGLPELSPYRVFHIKPAPTLSRLIVDQQLTYRVVYLNGSTLSIHRISDLSSKKWKNYKLNQNNSLFPWQFLYTVYNGRYSCSTSTLTPSQEYNTHIKGATVCTTDDL